MKKNNLNEELINQLRLMSFDRSKTLFEQNERRITLYGQIFNGLDGKPCDGCNVKLYRNPDYFASKLNNHEYYENLFKNEAPMNSTTTYNGYYTIGEIDINPGPYALVANGSTTRDYTTIYFNVINSGTLTNNIQLYDYTKDLPTFTKFGGQLGKLYNKWVERVNHFNQLVDNNHTDNRYVYSFPDPQKKDPNYKWTTNDMREYVDGVQKSIDELNNIIKKGNNYLKSAGKFIDDSSLKPLDVVKEYGTTKGFSEMHGLYSIGGNAVNLWRDWMNNDGQYLDPKSVKLTPEQIDYIKQGGKRKLDNFLNVKDDMFKMYHDYAPYLALLFWVVPGGQPVALGIEGVDAIIYATHDEDYYMAGLSALFTAMGAYDDLILGGPAGKTLLKNAISNWSKKKTITKAQKESIKYFLKRALPKVAIQGAKITVAFVQKLFKIMKTNYAWALYILGELWKNSKILPNFLKKFIEVVSKLTITVGGVTWTWDLIAYFSGLCNTQPFGLAAETWNDNDHWWITNILLGDVLVPYMGWSQSWTTPCGKLEYQAATNEVIDSLSEEKKELIKKVAEKENKTEEEKKQLIEFGKEVESTRKQYKDSLEVAKTALLNKTTEMESNVTNFTDHVDDKFSEYAISRLHTLMDDLKKKGAPVDSLNVDNQNN
jgi:hypothetical protein